MSDLTPENWIGYRGVGPLLGMADVVGGGPFDLKAGQVTDDTQMAVCLAS